MKYKLFILLLAGLLFTGCSSAGPVKNKSSFDSAASTNMMMDDGSSSSEVPAMVSDQLTAYKEEEAASKEELGELEQASPKRTYHANVSVQATDFESSSKDLRELVKQEEGFIQNEDLSGLQNEQGRYGGFVCRIPTDRYDAFLEALDHIGNVTNINKWTDNITKNYYNTTGYIDSLTKERDRLNDLMQKAESVSDLVAIEDKLFDVEHQLQSYQNDLSVMDMDLEYSNIYVTLFEVQVYTNTNRSAWNRIPEAFKNTWIFFADGLGSLCLSLIYALPWLLVLALLGWILWKVLAPRFGKLKEAHFKKHEAGSAPSDPCANTQDTKLGDSQ